MARYWSKKNRRNFARGIAAGVFLLTMACGNNDAGPADGLIAAVKEQYAPDKRTVLFAVSTGKRGGSILISGETSSPPAKKALFRLLDSAGVDVVDSLLVLPGSDVGEELFGIARLSVCNLRVAPGHSEEMATQVLLGTPLRILRDEGSWLQVQTPENYIAWTQASGLVRMDSARFAAWQSRPRLIFTAGFGQAFVESGVAEKGTAVIEAEAVVSDLVIGDILALDGEERDFYRVEFPDGRMARVRKDQATPLDHWVSNLEPSGESVLHVARQMMGAPYLWGGTSSKGVDCSGFTKTAYFMNGIILPRDASQQVLAGEPVDIYAADTVSIAACVAHLRTGDLIFFTNDPARRNQEKARITHVGIYIGNGEFIHSSGFVHQSSLLDTAKNYSQWHAATLTKARRILGNDAGTALLANHPLY